MKTPPGMEHDSDEHEDEELLCAKINRLQGQLKHLNRRESSKAKLSVNLSAEVLHLHEEHERLFELRHHLEEELEHCHRRAFCERGVLSAELQAEEARGHADVLTSALAQARLISHVRTRRTSRAALFRWRQRIVWTPAGSREKARRLRAAVEGPAVAAEPAAARTRSTSPRRAPAIGGARRSEDHPLRDRSPTPNADRAEGRDRRPEFDQDAPATEIREFDQNAPASEVRSDRPRNDRKGKGKGKKGKKGKGRGK